MSKISPMQAEALGLKAAAPATKPEAEKAATTEPAKTAAKAPTKVAAKVAAKPAVAAKATPKAATKAKPVTKTKAAHKAKPAAKAKAHKVKMERDSFTMPKEEYAQLAQLKARLVVLGQPAKKSELLRAGIKLLVAMSDNTLKATMAKVPVIKTGRPKKK